ncbi:FAD-dependent oxidoreductase [Rhodobacter sp. SGA-6-6]|uniref:FAD/NAD(P)-binding protein n=1 Tax=Rhodobacter sp. SGA-6-6 TaxID=2710882 RepID=UPI0013ED1274|nr:FAD/NAD(P)-binding protein [Rhodobacter sp. SGA-6-6]NGM46255.1 FAD-dependent oxidoreductase [Rhodobacter sp. SGA-6-6]
MTRPDQPAAARPPGLGWLPPQPHVVVIGGGASGVLMAVQLLSRPDRAFRVTLLEPARLPGPGLAYATADPDHLLNTRVRNMSAFPDRPGHFHDWLAARAEGATPECFVSRATYGAYLADLLAPWAGEAVPQRLRIVRQEALRLQDSARGVVVRLADGQTVIGDLAVLATGHVHEAPAPGLSGAWDAPAPPDPDGRVILVGSGLSMVDRVVTLLKSGHRGEILAVSRRGLVPRAHAAGAPLPVSRAEVPFGAPVSALAGWARALVRRAEAQGGSWRDAVDGIRPHVQAIWRSLPPVERARFLRHAAAWWDVHRHRVPPASEAVVHAALASGQLRLQRAEFLGAELLPSGPVARIRLFGGEVGASIPAARIFDCRGIRRDPGRNASALIADLLARGRARVDPLRIGLEVDTRCRLVDGRGRPADRLLAIGPVSRAAFWEITAIPDIRDQVQRLATELAVA